MLKLHDAMSWERARSLPLFAGIAVLLLRISGLAGCADPNAQGKSGLDDTGIALDDTSPSNETGGEVSCEEQHDPADCDTGSSSTVDADGDGVLPPTDCDDGNPWVYPGASEICDGVDQDCDGEIWLEEDAYGCTDFYEDADGDGYGYDGGATSSRCLCDDDGAAPEGTSMVQPVTTSGDCDDTDAAHYPGATPVCDTWADDDCDGALELSPAESDLTYTIDEDEDGWGTRDPRSTSCGVALPAESSAPPVEELCLCSGEIPLLGEDLSSEGVSRLEPLEVTVTGGDGAEVTAQGYLLRWGDLQWRFLPPGVALDCVDADSEYHWTILYLDKDLDGFGDSTDPGTPLCPDTPGYTADHGDCSDSDFSTHPTAPEACGDGDGTSTGNVDRDCDGSLIDTDNDTDGVLYYLDLDGDGFGYPDAELGRRFCVEDADDDAEARSLGYSPLNTDCNDLCEEVYPDAEEICEDDTDNDCDGAMDSDDVCTIPVDTGDTADTAGTTPRKPCSDDPVEEEE